MADLDKLRKQQERMIREALKPVHDLINSGAFQAVIDIQVAKQAQYMAEQQARLNELLEPSHNAINKVLNSVSESVRVMTAPNLSETVKIFESLPKLPDISAIYGDTFKHLEGFVKIIEEEGRKSDEKLDEIGFGFAIEILMRVFSYQVFDNMGYAHRMEESEVIATFTQIVELPEFKPKLLEPFQKVGELKNRTPIIETAYDLHQQGNYIASIPLLLIQIEVLVRTLLFLREHVEVKGSKVFLLENGAKKVDENGNPIEINGLGELLKNSQLEDDEHLNRLANLLSNKLVSARNDILHGTSYKYGKEKTSTQCILVVFCLAHVIYGLDELEFDI